MPEGSVSVVITSFNRPQWLREAAESVLAQDRAPSEVVILDDASGPDALHVADLLVKAHRQIRLVRAPRSRGVHRGLCEVGPSLIGDYFAILNDDDRWEKGFLRELASALDHDADLVASFCDNFVIDDRGTVDNCATENLTKRCHRDVLPSGRHENSASLVGSSSFPSVIGSLFRNGDELWNAYVDAVHDVAGSYDLWLLVCTLGNASPVWYSPHRLASYRVHRDQTIARRDARLSLASVWVLQQALGSPKFTSIRSQLIRRIGRGYHATGTRCLRDGDNAMAAYYLRLALALRPRPRTVAALALSWKGLRPLLQQASARRDRVHK